MVLTYSFAVILFFTVMIMILELDLSKAGWNDEEICKKLGMELDEVIRLKQITGLKEAFQNHDFSKSWEEFETKYYKDGIK